MDTWREFEVTWEGSDTPWRSQHPTEETRVPVLIKKRSAVLSDLALQISMAGGLAQLVSADKNQPLIIAVVAATFLAMCSPISLKNLPPEEIQFLRQLEAAENGYFLDEDKLNALLGEFDQAQKLLAALHAEGIISRHLEKYWRIERKIILSLQVKKIPQRP